jgi:NAD(P)-dependent dehydrogenase (short-subunit alcohol dehydrogenase family)
MAEMLHADREDQVALRSGKRFVARFVRLSRDSALPDEALCRRDATYLITGGLGMLGLKVAQWLVEQQGVRYLVLTGRRGAQGAAQDAVRALEALGAHVHVMQADMTVEAEVQRTMATMQQHLPPLKGVVYCAGLLDDGVLSQLDWPQFTRVTAPKVKGG